MASVALSLVLLAGTVVGQSSSATTTSYASASTVDWPATPLISLSYPRPSDAPYQVFSYDGHDIYTRGYQSGYNICNSTTEGDSSLCQTIVQNGIDDFCLWGPPSMNEIGNAEGDVVAYCTKSGHGTRIMPEGTIKGIQVLYDGEAYMMTGIIDQTKININASDSGGELDSGGQDGRGNPIGGLLYSLTFSPDDDLYQVRHWTEFIGNDMFCFKWCNDNGTNPDGKCQHTLDRIGMAYNCPSKYSLGSYTEGEYEYCDSDSFPVPGVYTDSAGTTYSYSQPAESLGAISTVPYTPTAAATSNCKTYASSDIFVAASSGATASATGSSAKATSTASSSNSTSSSSSDSGASETLGMSLFATVVGILAAVAMFA